MKIVFGAFACLSAAIPLSMAAAADPEPESLGVVAVAEPPGPSAELAELTAQLRTACAQETQGVLDARQLQERMGEVPGASLAEIDRAYSGAVATYHSGDYEGSIRSLRAVIAELEKLPDSADVFSQWTRAMLRLARAEANLGRKVDAEEILDRLVRANPNLKVDLSQYPPSFQAEIDKRRARLATLPKRTLEVTSTRKDARIFVERREVGTAPVSLSVPPGRYRVSAAADGVRLAGRMVDLSEQDQTVALDFEIAEALRPNAGPGLAISAKSADDRSRGVITAGAWLGLDRVIAARFGADGGVTFLNATLYDVRRGAVEREGTIRLGAGNVAAPGAVSELARFVIRNGPCVVCVNRDRRPPSHMGWGAFAAGVAFVGLGGFSAYQGINSQGHYNSAADLLVNGVLPTENRDAYFGHLRQGDSARSTAYITLGGAVVTAAVAGVLGYLSYKQSGEIGPFRF